MQFIEDGYMEFIEKNGYKLRKKDGVYCIFNSDNIVVGAINEGMFIRAVDNNGKNRDKKVFDFMSDLMPVCANLVFWGD